MMTPLLLLTTLSFVPFSVAEVHKALKQLNSRKPAGPNHLNPLFLKLAAEIIAEPLTHLFNLSLAINDTPGEWRVAHVVPLLKGGDPKMLPISTLFVLAQVLESLSSEQVREYLNTHQILSKHQLGFRKKPTALPQPI